MYGRGSVTIGVRSFGDSLASEVARYRGTMVDPDARGCEKSEDSELGLKGWKLYLLKWHRISVK